MLLSPITIGMMAVAVSLVLLRVSMGPHRATKRRPTISSTRVTQLNEARPD